MDKRRERHSMIGNPWQKQFNQLENRKLKKKEQKTEKQAENLVDGYIQKIKKHGTYTQPLKEYELDEIKQASLKKIIDNVVDNMIENGISPADTMKAVTKAIDEVDLDAPDYSKLQTLINSFTISKKQPYKDTDMATQIALLSTIANETRELKEHWDTNFTQPLLTNSLSSSSPFPPFEQVMSGEYAKLEQLKAERKELDKLPTSRILTTAKLNATKAIKQEEDRIAISQGLPSRTKIRVLPDKKAKNKSKSSPTKASSITPQSKPEKKLFSSQEDKDLEAFLADMFDEENSDRFLDSSGDGLKRGKGLFGIPNMGISKTAETMVYGRKTLPPPVLNFLAKHGTEPISQMFVQRTPLSNLLMNVINVGSVFTFKKGIENEAYDKLYHLRLLIRTKQGHNFILEKIDHINIMNDNTLDRKDLEQREVRGIPTIAYDRGVKGVEPLNLDILLKRTEQAMGSEKFLKYSSRDSNCQDFVLNVLRSSGLLTADLQEFIKQPVKAIINDRTSKLANTLTDLGASVDVLLHGAGASPFNRSASLACRTGCNGNNGRKGKKRVIRGKPLNGVPLSLVEIHGTNHLKKKATKLIDLI